MNHKCILRDGSTMNYSDGGEGPVLVFIHGFCEDYSIWNNIAEDLISDYRILQVDCIGFGNSTPGDSFGFSMREQAAALDELLSLLKIDHAVFIGHSMGGYISLCLLSIHPELFKGMVLVHSTADSDTPERKENRNKTIQLVERSPQVFIREFYYNLFAPHRKNEFEREIGVFREKANCILSTSIIGTLKGLRDRENTIELLRNSSIHKLIVAGRYDLLIPVNQLKKLAEYCFCDYDELENSGHMGFLEEPQNLHSVIKNWLKKI